MIIKTTDNMAIQFPLDKINPVGKTAKGVIGIKLNDGASVAEVVVGTEYKQMPVQNRAGKGIKLS